MRKILLLGLLLTLVSGCGSMNDNNVPSTTAPVTANSPAQTPVITILPSPSPQPTASTTITLLPTITHSYTPWPSITPTFTMEPTSTSIPNTSGLIISENELTSLKELDISSFSPQQIMLFRDAQLMIQPVNQYQMSNNRPDAIEAQYPMTGGTEYDAVMKGDNNTGEATVSIEQHGTVIFSTKAGTWGPVPTIQGLWVADGHWTLELAITPNGMNGNDTDASINGRVYQDSILLNQKYGYQEMFGYMLLHEKPFYFYENAGQVHLSYSGKDLPFVYDEVFHYHCCEPAGLDPWPSPNWVFFFGQRKGVWYLTEIGQD